MTTRYHLIITGIVQGVCYRYYTRERAVELGVTGWVRNRMDGSVEVVAEGGNDALAALTNWCREGPSHAHVADVAVTHGEGTGEFARFRIV